MTEILVKPYQSGAEELAGHVFNLLRVYPHLEWIAPSLDIAVLAAQIRAKHRLKMADALQAATANFAGATCLIGNDAEFRKVDGLKVLLLDDYA
jgi:predicted nucleic acid-binding protein